VTQPNAIADFMSNPSIEFANIVSGIEAGKYDLVLGSLKAAVDRRDEAIRRQRMSRVGVGAQVRFVKPTIRPVYLRGQRAEVTAISRNGLYGLRVLTGAGQGKAFRGVPADAIEPA